MAKKSKKQTQEDIIRLIHPDIGSDETDDMEYGATPAPKADTPDYAALLAAMQSQVATMQTQMETLHRTNMALMAQPASAPQAPQVQEFSMDGLPDPSLQPTEYAREVNRRVQESIRSQAAVQAYQTTQTQSQSSTEEALWEAFQSKYGAYAGDQKRVRYVAEQVVTDAQKRGLDINKYVTGARDVFMADVVNEYDKVFGKPVTDEDEDDDADDDATDNRTGGMFGGIQSGGRPTTTAEGDDMFTLLRQKKIKEGWY